MLMIYRRISFSLGFVLLLLSCSTTVRSSPLSEQIRSLAIQVAELEKSIRMEVEDDGRIWILLQTAKDIQKQKLQLRLQSNAKRLIKLKTRRDNVKQRLRMLYNQLESQQNQSRMVDHLISPRTNAGASTSQASYSQASSSHASTSHASTSNGSTSFTLGIKRKSPSPVSLQQEPQAKKSQPTEHPKDNQEILRSGYHRAQQHLMLCQSRLKQEIRISEQLAKKIQRTSDRLKTKRNKQSQVEKIQQINLAIAYLTVAKEDCAKFKASIESKGNDCLQKRKLIKQLFSAMQRVLEKIMRVLQKVRQIKAKRREHAGHFNMDPQLVVINQLIRSAFAQYQQVLEMFKQSSKQFSSAQVQIFGQGIAMIRAQIDGAFSKVLSICEQQTSCASARSEAQLSQASGSRIDSQVHSQQQQKTLEEVEYFTDTKIKPLTAAERKTLKSTISKIVPQIQNPRVYFKQVPCSSITELQEQAKVMDATQLQRFLAFKHVQTDWCLEQLLLYLETTILKNLYRRYIVQFMQEKISEGAMTQNMIDVLRYILGSFRDEFLELIETVKILKLKLKSVSQAEELQENVLMAYRALSAQQQLEVRITNLLKSFERRPLPTRRRINQLSELHGVI